MNETQNFKKALLFTLSLLPVAIIGGICTAIYQLDTLSEEMVQQAVSQLGSVEILIAITTSTVPIMIGAKANRKLPNPPRTSTENSFSSYLNSIILDTPKIAFAINATKTSFQ